MSLNKGYVNSQEVELLKNDLVGLNDVYKDIADEIGLENDYYEFTVKNTSVVPINIKIKSTNPKNKKYQ